MLSNCKKYISELKSMLDLDPLKNQNKEHTCKFKIEKITYSQSRATYDVRKNKPLVYL